MNVLFLTLVQFDSLQERNIYTDLLRECEAEIAALNEVAAPLVRGGASPSAPRRRRKTLDAPSEIRYA